MALIVTHAPVYVNALFGGGLGAAIVLAEASLAIFVPSTYRILGGALIWGTLGGWLLRAPWTFPCRG